MSPWLSDLFLRSQTDERLVSLARTGQERAFSAIVERYRRELLALARRLDGGRAEDLVQQTFLSAFSALQADADVRHLRGWLYQILRNLAARDAASWAMNEQLGEADAMAESAAQIAERRMLALDALTAVAALPPGQHVALVQTALQGRSRTEVAHGMGLSEGAVRQLVHRARTTLRTAVTAITPLPLLRWFAGPSSGGSSLSEMTLSAGTASTAGITVKLGVGAVLATGVVATGVITVVAPHHGHGSASSHRLTAELASRDGSGRTATVHAGRSAPSVLTGRLGGRVSRGGSVGAARGRRDPGRAGTRPQTGTSGFGSVTGDGSLGRDGSGSDGGRSGPESSGTARNGPDGVPSGTGGGPGSGGGRSPGGGSDGSGSSDGGSSRSDGGSSGGSDGGLLFGATSSGGSNGGTGSTEGGSGSLSGGSGSSSGGSGSSSGGDGSSADGPTSGSGTSGPGGNSSGSSSPDSGGGSGSGGRLTSSGGGGSGQLGEGG